MNTKTTNYITLAIALLGTLLTMADQWIPAIAAIFPNATHSGPIIIGVVTVVRVCLQEINRGIQLVLLFATLQFAGCAGSGQGGAWTPQDTAAVGNALNGGIDSYNRIAHPEYFYRPVVPVVPIPLWRPHNNQPMIVRHVQTR